MAHGSLPQTFLVPLRQASRSFGSLPVFVGDRSNEAIKYLISPKGLRPSDWPLVLHGPSGTGKTELAQAVADLVTQKPGQKHLITPAVDFARAYLSAIQTDSVKDFESKYFRLSCLVLDQIDELRRFPKVQLELIRLIDVYANRNQPLIMTASDSFFEISDILPQVFSRLSSGLCLPVNPPGAEAQSVIIDRLAEIHGITVSLAARDFLVEKFQATVPKINQLFHQVRTLKSGLREIDTADIQEYFVGSSCHDPEELTDRIIQLVATEFNIQPKDIKAATRKQTIATARSVCVYFLRELLLISFAKIGNILGGRDHSTIMHAHKKIMNIVRESNSENPLPGKIAKLEHQIKGLLSTET